MDTPNIGTYGETFSTDQNLPKKVDGGTDTPVPIGRLTPSDVQLLANQPIELRRVIGNLVAGGFIAGVQRCHERGVDQVPTGAGDLAELATAYVDGVAPGLF